LTAHLSSSRFLQRRGLTTLSLNHAGPQIPPVSYAQDPEITHATLWVRRLPVGFESFRIVHLTDIHHSLFTPLEEVQRAVHLANSLEPDIVALTGDYVTLSPAYIGPVADALGGLRARYGVFAVLGNHDFQVDAEEITRALRARYIHVLRNAHHRLRDHTGTFWLLGIDDLWSGRNNLGAALNTVPARDLKVLLCHNPQGIYEASAHAIDLVLSGHTHGGQVRLPLVGSVRGRSKLGERFVEGWNRLDGTQIYVNRGIGKSVVPFRVEIGRASCRERV